MEHIRVKEERQTIEQGKDAPRRRTPKRKEPVGQHPPKDKKQQKKQAPSPHREIKIPPRDHASTS